MYNRNLPLNVQLEQNNDQMTPIHNQNPLFDNQDTTFLLPDVKNKMFMKLLKTNKKHLLQI